MKLVSKLILSFACVSILIAVIGVTSNQYSSSIKQQFISTNAVATKMVGHTVEMQRALYQSLIYLNAIQGEELKNPEGPSGVMVEPTVNRLRQQFNEETALFYRFFDSLKVDVSHMKLDIAVRDTLEMLIGSLEDRSELMTDLSRNWINDQNRNSAEARLVYVTTIEPYFRNQLIPVVGQLRNQVVDIQQRDSNVLNGEMERSAVVMLWTTFGFILISFGIAFYIYQSIADPLRRLRKSAIRLGEGDYSGRIEIDTKDELGELAESFNSMSESIVANNVSREYFFNILESMREAIIVTDKDGIVQGVNTSTSDLLIFSEPEMRGRTISSFFSTQDTPDRNKKPVEKGQFKESLMITKRGRSIPVLYSENDLLDAKNAVIGKVYVAADMTARKEYEERLQQSLHEKEVLLAEIHHRVKNNLAVISGLLQLQSFSSNNKTVAKALKDSQMRIQSISLVHELLYQNESLAYIQYDRYINDLLQAIQLTHSTPEVDIRLSSQVDPIALGINQAVPCSLLLNELIVNAYKHAFKGIDEGKINIYATMDDDQMVTIKVCDNGVGLDMKRLNESKSLGMTLIKTLTKQLDGTFETGRNPDGPGSYSVYSFKKESIVSDFAG